MILIYHGLIFFVVVHVSQILLNVSQTFPRNQFYPTVRERISQLKERANSLCYSQLVGANTAKDDIAEI